MINFDLLRMCLRFLFLTKATQLVAYMDQWIFIIEIWIMLKTIEYIWISQYRIPYLDAIERPFPGE